MSELVTRVTVAGCSIKVPDQLKFLGVTLDASLTFERHINDLVKSCNFHIRALWHLCQSLICNVVKSLAGSIVGSTVWNMI